MRSAPAFLHWPSTTGSFVALCALLLATALTATAQPPEGRSFYAFESDPVKPLARSPNGRLLFVTNVPDNRLEVLRILPSRLLRVGSVPVGMEPVSVAARSDSEAWVTNLLSDSVSIVRLEAGGARVVRTLEVGDEPRSVVFAGPQNRYAFIATAHRTLERSAGEGSADVWVFDTQDLGTDPGGTPLTVINLFSDVPRALAVSPDGSRVYAAAYKSGNRTSMLPRSIVRGDLPPPLTNVEGVPLPDQGLIVKFDGEKWVDAAGRDQSMKVNFNLADNDVFVIDAVADVPALVDTIEGVGTTLFNIAVDPSSGDLFVSNLESLNDVRFEGPGEFGGSTVRGHFAENRITVIDAETRAVMPRHLNKHIDFERFPGTPAENASSLAMPVDMVVTGDGRTLYVAAFGSRKVGRFSTAALRDDSFVPRPSAHIELPGGGPAGLALDEGRGRLYVYTRFDNAVSVIDLAGGEVLSTTRLYNPEPRSIVEGRRFLYDARYTSSRGDSSCAGCHIFGDKDEMGWNLGDPDKLVTPNANPFQREPGPGQNKDWHPMKGPLMTQSLRGMAGQGPMHWRGDRSGANEPGGDALDENAAFLAFNVAFEGLLGRTAPLTDEEMQQFADFALQLFYPPNPLRRLDNTLDGEQGFGRQLYFSKIVTDSGDRCNDCHRLSPEEGLFGTIGESIIRDDQAIKIPHLRNMYTKLAAPEVAGPPPADRFRGFAFRHTGELQTMTQLMGIFDLGDDFSVRSVVEYLMVIETDLAPVAGQQITIGEGLVDAEGRLDLLRDRALQVGGTPECELIAKGRVNGQARGWLLLDSGEFRSDRAAEALLSYEQLTALAATPGQELTFTCAPPGAGERMGIDRDEDGILDGDESA